MYAHSQVVPIGTVIKGKRLPTLNSDNNPNEDNRSVHNDADIARIQTLQEQLDAQALKLKTITDLLFKNGAI